MLPSIIVIIIVAKILDAFKESKLVSDIFSGLRPASTAMIASAGFRWHCCAVPHREFHWAGSIPSVLNYKAILLAIVVYITIKKFDKHPIVYIVASAVVGIIFQF